MAEHIETLGLYAGSFDPITRGHFNIVKQAASLFDRVQIAIGQNPRKTRLFDFEQAKALIQEAVAEEGFPQDRITISSFGGSLKAAALESGASAIIRGLRQVSDFNDEFSLHGVLERSMDLPVVYLICRHEFLHVSSSTARELASLGEPIDWLVHAAVRDALEAKYR